jgi:hypothetical protein
MSEIRKVAVRLSNLENVQAACKQLGFDLVKQGSKVLVRNHGVYTYGRDIELIQQKDGSYSLQGDASETELEKLAEKMRCTYAEITVKSTMNSISFNGVSREVDKQKGKIRLKYVGWK